MEIQIITKNNNHREIGYKLCGFLQAHGINTREKLELFFDILANQYAEQNGGQYDAQRRILRIDN